jgi:hypothetical protein
MSNLHSNLQAAIEAPPPVDPATGLMSSVAELLIPLFKTSSIDRQLARQIAASAIEAYCPETRADFVNVARTIAFSMAALALLGKTASDDLTMPEQLKAFGRANALNRSADQSERTMMQRRRYLQTTLPAEQPDYEPDVPRVEIGDTEMQAAITEALNEYLAHGGPTGTEVTTSDPAQAAPPLNPIQIPAASSTSAIRYPTPRTEAVRPWTAPPWTGSFKSGLLAQSALHNPVGATHDPHKSPQVAPAV